VQVGAAVLFWVHTVSVIELTFDLGDRGGGGAKVPLTNCPELETARSYLPGSRCWDVKNQRNGLYVGPSAPAAHAASHAEEPDRELAVRRGGAPGVTRRG